jgi:hypothetical protein
MILHNSRVDSTGYDRTRSVLKALSSYKLNIYIANPEWGINKKTGQCSKENIQMNEIIQSSSTLLKLREFCVSFKAVIAGNSISDIVAWIEKYKNESFAHLRTFATGLIAEGLNNKLKALKRDMYGRAGNRLIEIKMVASLTG